MHVQKLYGGTAMPQDPILIRGQADLGNETSGSFSLTGKGNIERVAYLFSIAFYSEGVPSSYLIRPESSCINTLKHYGRQV
jgi:hypothetical protein